MLNERNEMQIKDHLGEWGYKITVFPWYPKVVKIKIWVQWKVIRVWQYFINLISKRNKLCHSIASVKPEMICMTQVPLKTASLPIDDCELQIQGFDCFTNNSKSQFHRSFLIYTKKCLKAVAINFRELDYQQYVYCKLSSKSSDFMFCAYTDLLIA